MRVLLSVAALLPLVSSLAQADAPQRHGSFPYASPDGKYIVFASSRDSVVPAGQSSWLHMHLYVMDADGTNVRQLTHSAAAETAPVWTPDGRWIVFGTIDPRANRETLDAVRPDGSARHTIMSGEFLPWVRISPDSRRIIFTATRDDQPAGIFTVDLDGSHRVAVETGLDRPWDGIYSPDGKHLVFSRWPPGEDPERQQTDVYIGDARGGHRRRLASYPGLIQVPSWSPDGRSIAYQTYTAKKGEADVVLLNVATGKFRRASRREAVYLDETPAWMPDGRLLFQSTRSGGRFEIYVMSTEGTDVHALTH